LYVTVLPNQNKPIRAFVAIREASDWGPGKHQGYRAFVEVSKDKVLMAQMLEEASREAKQWADRYGHIKKCAGIVSRMRKTFDW
jgi:hypothetical protein